MNKRGSYKYINYMENVLSPRQSGHWANIVSYPHLLMCLNVVLFMKT